MRSLSVLLFACLAVSALAQAKVEGRRDMGRLGVWISKSQAAFQLEETEREEGGPFVPRFPVGLGPSVPRQFGPFTSVQVNVDAQGRNILGDAANEPSMTVDPNNRQKVAIGWRQFNSVFSNFRQAGYGYSTDGGGTWTFPGLLEQNVFRSDPVLGTDSAGRFYYLSLKETFFDDMWGSMSGGSAWTRLGDATGGDKQWFTVDRTAGVGAGFLYQYWSTAGNNWGGRQFSRSTNGIDWMDPINVPGNPIWGTLDVGRNGDLYLAGLADPYRFNRSTNARNALVTPTFDRSVTVDLGGSLVYGGYVNPVGLAGQVWLACDKSNGSNGGNIYMLCSVAVDANNPCDVNFVRSTDGGLTWSRPVRINDDAPNVGSWHWFGAMSVAPNGRIDVCWYDTRANPGNANSALYFSSSKDGGRTWAPSRQLSASFDPTIGYPQQNKIGDYIAVVSDNLGANIAYSATFNGEEDIWFVRVPMVNQYKAVSLTLLEGRSLDGAVFDTWEADGATADARSISAGSMGQLATIRADFQIAERSPTTMTLKLRAKSSVRPTTGIVWLYNFRTARYDLGRLFPMATSLTDWTVTPSGTPSDYADTTGSVRIAFRGLTPVRFRPPGITVSTDWLSLEAG